MYPLRRNRRLRTSDAIRSLVRETIISPNDFLVPLFVVEGKGVKVTGEAKTVAEGAASKATQGSAHREMHGHQTDTLKEELNKDDVVEHLKKSGGMSQVEAEEKAEYHEDEEE